MFFRTSQKRFPHLCRYVEQAVNRQATTGQEVGAVSLMTLAGIAVPASIVVGFVLVQPILAIMLGLAGIGCAMGSWKAFKGVSTTVDRLDLEAADANRMLGDALRRGKLHRIAGDATTSLLEECARYWSRAKQALESPFWSSPLLPPHYQSVRQQIARAADRAMDEAVVLLHNELEAPYKSGMADRVSVSELVEGIFGVQLPDAGASLAPLPFAYQNVRQLAHKLQELAENVEALTHEVAQDPAVKGEFQAETGLDLVISELQQIRQAEDELRQNITG